MAEALINHQVLAWARRRARLSLDEAAGKSKLTQAQLLAWEEGKSRPSLAKAMELAKVLRVPFATLFLSAPPKDRAAIPDLRTVGGHQRGLLSADLIEVIELAVLKQQWFRDYRSSAQPLPLEHSNDISNLALTIRSSLDWNDSVRRENSGPVNYLSALVKLAEAFGVLVLRSGVVGNNNSRTLQVAEFRGFALADRVAPLIFINSNDSKTAQVFTFAHELIHIWMGSSGVSSSAGSQEAVGTPDIEILCNTVAAELLTPRVDFEEFWSRKPFYRAAASYFRVSEQVSLRRAFDLKLVSEKIFRETLEQIPLTGSARKSSGGNFDKTLPARNSVTFTQALLSEVRNRRADVREASRLLGIKPATLVKLASRRSVV